MFCALPRGKKRLKNGPKTIQIRLLSCSVIFSRICPDFYRFFPSSYVPKNRLIPTQFQDFHRFSQNPIFGSLKLQKRLEMQARTSFFRANRKKHRKNQGRRQERDPG